MGIIKSIGKVVFFPVYAPIKAYAASKKSLEEKRFAAKPKIHAVVDTAFPGNYREFYEMDGYKTDFISGRVVVWEKGLTEKELEKLRKELL